MTFRRTSRQIYLSAATVVLGGLLVCNGQLGGPGQGKPIQFSAPRREGGTTNWQQLLSKPDSLKQLEEDSYRPQQPAAPPSSLDGVVALPPQAAATTAIQNKRVKEMMERQKNWVFMTPKELFGAPTVEGILKGPALRPDGKEQKDAPAIERYYERLVTKDSAANDPAHAKDDELVGTDSQSKPRDGSATQEDSDLPSNVKESADALKKMLGLTDSDNPFVRDATHGSLSDIFGLGDNAPSREQIQDHKKYMDEYHSLLDAAWKPPAAAVPGSPLDILGGMGASAGKPATGLPSVSTPVLNQGLEPQAGVLNSALGPPGLPEVNVQALGQAGQASVLPKIEPTRTTPIAPSFDAPRRAFH